MSLKISTQSPGYDCFVNITDRKYGAGFFLTISSLQGPWGKMYKLFSHKWTMLCALSMFEIGSLICGMHKL